MLFALASGFAATLAGRHELRKSPRPLLLTGSFVAFFSYAVLVLVPASVYFYVFHGDWSLFYFVDVSKVPSAIALLGFVAQVGLGAMGFLLGGMLVRNQREAIVGVLLGLVLVAGGVVTALYSDRLAVVGRYREFHKDFGLSPYEAGPLMTGGMVMAGIVLVGLIFLLVRLWLAGRSR